MADKDAKRAQPRKLVMIEEGTLISLSLNAAILKEFPFLGTIGAKTKPRGCGSCGRAAAARSAVFGDIKRQIASMADDRKRRLKELLHAEKARILYRNASGRAVELTF